MLEAWTLNSERVHERDEALRARLREFPDTERAAFYKEYNRKIRDPDTYAVLNWLFLTGLHHFYLGRWLRALFNLAVMIGGVALLFGGYPEIGFWMIVAILAIELPALFRSQLIVADFNTRVAEEILDRRQADSGISGQ